MGDAVLAAELDHGRGSGDAEFGLERSGLVIDAGVDDAAVVSALVPGNAVFFFEDEKSPMRESLGEFEGDCESDDATANDHYVVGGFGHGEMLYDCLGEKSQRLSTQGTRGTLRNTEGKPFQLMIRITAGA